MAEYYYDDWNDDDQIHIDDHYARIVALENSVAEAEYTIQEYKDSSIFTLAQLIEARECLLSNSKSLDGLFKINKIIQGFTHDEVQEAIKVMDKWGDE